MITECSWKRVLYISKHKIHLDLYRDIPHEGHETFAFFCWHRECVRVATGAYWLLAEVWGFLGALTWLLGQEWQYFWLPGGPAVKNVCQFRRYRTNPWSRKIPMPPGSTRLCNATIEPVPLEPGSCCLEPMQNPRAQKSNKRSYHNKTPVHCN